jgi:hypothetical protein
MLPLSLILPKDELLTDEMSSSIGLLEEITKNIIHAHND